MPHRHWRCGSHAGESYTGIKLLGAADTLLTAIGASLEADDRIPYEYTKASAHTQLDDVTFAAAQAEGQAMSLEEAVNYAFRS